MWKVVVGVAWEVVGVVLVVAGLGMAVHAMAGGLGGPVARVTAAAGGR